MKKRKVSFQTLGLEFKETKSTQVFNEIYRYLRPRLVSFLKKYHLSQEDLQDVLTETFSNIWNRIDIYDPKWQFSTWCFTIAKNEALMSIRKSKNLKEDYILDQDERPSKVEYKINMSDDYFDNFSENIMDLVLKEIDKLPEKYKQSLLLFSLDKYSYKEMSEKLGIPVNTVKTHIFQGKKKLQKLILQNKQLSEYLYEKGIRIS